MLEYLSWVFVALSLIGNFFVIKRSVIGYWLWVAANIGWIFYDVHMKAYSQAMLFSAYLILSIWGIYEWSKKPAKKEDEKVKSNG